MSSTVQRLHKKGLIRPPQHLLNNIHYETLTGSVAYGVSDDASDSDILGFCIPPKTTIFPHLAGEIPGFGRQIKRFEQWQEHHIEDKEDRKNYDFSIYNIVKYFQLCMENNPNMINSLFTPDNCILHITRVGTLVRENRKLFLHKGSWQKFKGYAYSQLHKMSIKTPEEGGKRYESVQKWGFDVKFAYHVVRLMDEVEQILETGDIDLQRDRERLKAIRRGEVAEEEIRRIFSDKEKSLENLYQTSKLQYSPDEKLIKQLLLNCLEEHYGSLEDAITEPDEALQTLRQVKELVDKCRVLNS